MNDDGCNSNMQIMGEGSDSLPSGAAYAAMPAFDAARYWDYLENVPATDAQKAALLETLWSVMASFVQLGFGVDPVQTVIPGMVRASMEEDGTGKQEHGEAVAAQRFNHAAVNGVKGEQQP